MEVGVAARTGGVLYGRTPPRPALPPLTAIRTYIERDDGVKIPLYAIHRDLALHMENSYLANESRWLRPLRWAFRIAVVALVAEVALWLIELATGR
jgi:hypothetical protein